MKDSQLESLLLGARPRANGQYSEMTARTMEQIRRQALLNQEATSTAGLKRSVFMKLRALHGIGLIVAVVGMFIVLSGVTYASIRFVPELIKVIDRKLNSSGYIEYSVPAFADCYAPGQLRLDTFEVNPAAGLSDDEVEKTLRAKCELMGMNKFANDTWPTYGEHKKWKSGDDIFYTRPDRLGKVQQISKHGVTLAYGSDSEPTMYKTFEHKELEAYARGERVAWEMIKPGDVVFSMVRVSEVYIEHRGAPGPDGVIYDQPNDNQPKMQGIVAVVRLSLPERYYGQMQAYVNEVQECIGNPDERCPAGHNAGVAIDVFPRGSEGARNPLLSGGTAAGRQGREIVGIVSAVEDGRLTITARSGNRYVAHIPRSIIDSYNEQAAPGYVPSLAPDITAVQLKKGSTVSILYSQKANADPRAIYESDIIRIMLLSGLSPKGSKP